MKKSDWIKFSDQLPPGDLIDTNRQILVFDGEEVSVIYNWTLDDYLLHNKRICCETMFTYNVFNPTHWMLLEIPNIEE